MKPAKRIIYRGATYFLQSSGRYYQNGNQNAPERLLHRVKWIERHGPIPDGMCVHHVNGDWTDDSPQNHALMTMSDHSKMTAAGLWRNPIMASKMEAGRKLAIQSAPSWHRSEAGRKWHREHAQRFWQKRRQQEMQVLE